ncbi:MAG: right-handed parallel beta-helix repeat-containing protein [Actinomycetota bacterium]
MHPGCAGGNEFTDNVSVANARTGIDVFATSDVTSDGVVVSGNTIAGNGETGLQHDGEAGSITGNSITDNGAWGMMIFGQGVVAENTITGNGADSIMVFGFPGSSSIGHYTISRNSISGNGSLGIDLGSDGVTKNDNGDADSGPNDLLNYPEFKKATDNGATTEAEGRVVHPDPQSLTLEIFVNDEPDASGFGEGQTFVTTATPDAKGRFSASLPGGLAGRFLTATSTDSAGNTSEFSKAREVRAGKK